MFITKIDVGSGSRKGRGFILDTDDTDYTKKKMRRHPEKATSWATARASDKIRSITFYILSKLIWRCKGSTFLCNQQEISELSFSDVL